MAAPDLISFGRGSYVPHELETTAREVRENLNSPTSDTFCSSRLWRR